MITQSLLLSLFIAACQCRSIKNTVPLPAPNLNKVTTFGGPPYGFSVEWEPVELNDQNPIRGYKVKMWKNEMVPIIFKVGTDWKKEYEPRDKPLHTIPNTAPVEQIVGVYETTARFEDVKLNVDYQVRVQAFNKLGYGPYSNALGIKVQGKKGLKIVV